MKTLARFVYSFILIERQRERKNKWGDGNRGSGNNWGRGKRRREKEREMETDYLISHSLIHFSNAYKFQGWAVPKPA